MIGKSIPGAAGLAAVLLWGGTASAVTVVDQVNLAAETGQGGGSFQDFGRAQTFTAGRAGLLSRIDAFVGVGNALATRLDLLSVTAGTPVGGGGGGNPDLLGSVTTGQVLSDGFGTFFSYDVSSLGLHVSVGDVIAFKVYSPLVDGGLESRNYIFTSDAGYAPGSAFFFNGGVPSLADWTTSENDLRFRTFVEVSGVPLPAPAALLLGGLGALALVGRFAAAGSAVAGRLRSAAWTGLVAAGLAAGPMASPATAATTTQTVPISFDDTGAGTLTFDGFDATLGNLLAVHGEFRTTNS